MNYFIQLNFPPIITKAFRNNTLHKMKLYTSYKVIKRIDSITSSSLIENNLVVESITQY